jgi:hypothetical protein
LNNPYRNKQFPMGNPLANILVIIVGALAIGASIVLGVVAFVTLGSLVLIMAAVIGVRLWWMNRKIRKNFAAGEKDGPTRREGVDVIEGEFRVVTQRKDTDSQ